MIPVYYCYRCGCLVNPKNRSMEHIILNSLGGRLKSDKLLCNVCNSELGHSGDSELAHQFAFLASYLQVSRDSGEFPIIKGGKTADGTRYNLSNGSKPSLADPVFKLERKGNRLQYSLTARSEKEMRQMLNGIKKSIPYLMCRKP